MITTLHIIAACVTLAAYINSNPLEPQPDGWRMWSGQEVLTSDRLCKPPGTSLYALVVPEYLGIPDYTNPSPPVLLDFDHNGDLDADGIVGWSDAGKVFGLTPAERGVMWAVVRRQFGCTNDSVVITGCP